MGRPGSGRGRLHAGAPRDSWVRRRKCTPWTRTRRACTTSSRNTASALATQASCISLPADLSTRLATPPLDGILMANSLHFFSEKEPLLRAVRTLLKPNGVLLLVEYNVDTGNLWVPYPLSFKSFQALAPRAGFTEPRLLARHASSFLHEFYSAAANKKASPPPGPEQHRLQPGGQRKMPFVT